MCKVTLKHTTSQETGTTDYTVITLSSSLGCVSAGEHHNAEKYSKTGSTNHESISQRATYHGKLAMTSSRYQSFEKLLWKPSEDASRKSSWNQMSLRI